MGNRAALHYCHQLLPTEIAMLDMKQHSGAAAPFGHGGVPDLPAPDDDVDSLLQAIDDGADPVAVRRALLVYGTAGHARAGLHGRAAH
jgi:hypothetical protein